MGDPIAEADFQHRRAGSQTDGFAAGVGHGDLFMPRLPARTDNPQHQNRRQHTREGHIEQVADAIEVRHRLRVRQVQFLDRRQTPGLVLRHQHQFSPTRPIADQGKHWDQQRGRAKKRFESRIAGLVPQPEMHADHAMNPGDDQKHRLKPGPDRITEDRQQDVAIIDIDAIKILSDAGQHDMLDQQRGDQQAKDQLHRLPAPDRHKIATPIDREHRDTEMGANRQKQGTGRNRLLPEQVEPFMGRDQPLKGIDPNRMIEQMTGHITEQRQAAEQPHAVDKTRPIQSSAARVRKRWIYGGGLRHAVRDSTLLKLTDTPYMPSACAATPIDRAFRATVRHQGT